MQLPAGWQLRDPVDLRLFELRQALTTRYLDCCLLPAAVTLEPNVQRFGEFLRDNPSGRELKRRRTHARFVADLGNELAEAAVRAGITPEQMSDWTLDHSHDDVSRMPPLRLFQEVLHEKLSDADLRWRNNVHRNIRSLVEQR